MPWKRIGRALQRTPYLQGLPPEVAVLAAVAFCVALGFGIVAPVIPVFAREFGVSALAASATVSVFALMRFVFSPTAGWLNDRFGERTVLATGLGIVAVSSALAGFSQSYVQLLGLRGIGGLGSAMFSVSAFSLLLRVAAPEQRGRASGAFQAGFLTGGIAGPAVGGIVVAISIRAPFFVYAGTLAIATVVTIVALRHTALAEAAPRGKGEAEVSGRAALGAALKQRAYVTALSVNLGNGFVAFGLRSALIPLFVVEGLMESPSLTGIGLLVSAAVQAVLLLPAGRMADDRGRKPALVIGTSATVAAMVVLTVIETTPSFMLAMALLGVSAAFLGSAPAAVVGDVTEGRRSGPVVAAFSMTSDLGAIAGPLVAGAVKDATGSFVVAFACGAAVAALSLVLSATMPETRKATSTSTDQSAAAPSTDPKD